MLSPSQIAQITKSAWFRTPWAPYVVVDSELYIRAANAAYESMVGRPLEALLDQPLFEVFPDNPADPDADGVANGSASMEAVLRSGTPHWMGVQRYDLPDPNRPGQFTYRVWTPVNLPITYRGKTIAVVHHTQDVTPVVPAPAHPAPSLGVDELQKIADRLARRFPRLPAEELVSLVTHSHHVVMDTLGAPDIEHTAALATLRLEVRAEHPPIEG